MPCLQDFFKAHPKLAVAVSGGVDSSYLLYAARKAGCDVRAYMVKSVFQPDFEMADASEVAALTGVQMTVLPVDVLADETIASNPADRCYHCKKALFGRLIAAAHADGFPVLADGTNASDDASDRPGMRALAELGALSPLRLCGLTKAEIRRLSREAGLPTSAKPAYACLATRVPTGTKITADMLARVEAAEGCLFSLGFSDFRVRLFEGAARIQLPAGQMSLLLEKRETVFAGLSPLFPAVFLDLAPRKAE